jgi:hypothetical protein
MFTNKTTSTQTSRQPDNLVTPTIVPKLSNSTQYYDNRKVAVQAKKKF